MCPFIRTFRSADKVLCGCKNRRGQACAATMKSVFLLIFARLTLIYLILICLISFVHFSCLIIWLIWYLYIQLLIVNIFLRKQKGEREKEH